MLSLVSGPVRGWGLSAPVRIAPASGLFLASCKPPPHAHYFAGMEEQSTKRDRQLGNHLLIAELVVAVLTLAVGGLLLVVKALIGFGI